MEHVVACYDQELTTEDSLSVMCDLALEHARRAGKYADTLLHYIRNNSYQSLVDMELSYSDDDTHEHLYHAGMALGFFKKNPAVPLGIDREAVALRKFEQSERDCSITNQRLVYHRILGFRHVSSELSAIIHRAQRKIGDVLGKVPRWDSLDFSFGPGATTTVKASSASPRFKLGSRLACSTEMYAFSGSLLAHCPALAQLHAIKEDADTFTVPVEIHAGKLQFVPKNAKTDRSIVVEPVLNGLAQKGIGTYMKKRLLRVAGINLWTQSRNQGMAMESSVSNKYATVDFSAASDTVSIETVALLLPDPWFALLSGLRTGTVVYRKGKKSTQYTLAKFSSMGNAFTFELETLIFWALASATCDHLGLDSEVSVYGDDVILDSDAFDLYKEVTSFLGFTINTEKSFVKGKFRESCGSDWFDGFSVRPFFLKSAVTARSLFVLHNFYMRNLDFDFAAKVLNFIHPELRIFGPHGYGDGHLIGSWSPKVTKAHRERGWDGGTFETFVDISSNSKNIRRARGDYILPCYSVYTRAGAESAYDPYVLRGVEGYKRIRIYTHQRGIFR